VMGGVMLIVAPLLQSAIGMSSFLRELVLVMIASGVGVFVYAGMAALVRLHELRWMVGMVRQRLGR